MGPPHIVKQILNKLPALTGLEQTPVAYWQEVLELSHRQAIEQHKQAAVSDQGEADDTPPASEQAPTDAAQANEAEETQPANAAASSLYLATELTT